VPGAGAGVVRVGSCARENGTAENGTLARARMERLHFCVALALDLDPPLSCRSYGVPMVFLWCSA